MIEDVYILYIDEPESIQYAEDCYTSCNHFNITPIKIQGVKGLNLKQLEDLTGISYGRPGTNQYENEYCATHGHWLIWQEIVKNNKPAIILEHDVIFKYDITNLKVEDGQIVFLGPRVIDREDYNYPGGEYTYTQVNRFEGAHAYAITPKTAKYMLDVIKHNNRIIMPVDGLLGIRNKFDLQLLLVDPPIAICEVGKRKSFAFGEPSYYNAQSLNGFKRGISKGIEELPLNQYYFTVDWFTHNIPLWEHVLKHVGWSKNDEIKVLEIGSYEGMSSCWISDNLLSHPNSFMVCVDTFKGSVEHQGQDNLLSLIDVFKHNILLSKNCDKVMVQVADSKQFLPTLNDKNIKFDFIYVDGSHETDDVIEDAKNCYALLNSGGIIIFDDYGWSMDGENYPVQKAIEQIEKSMNLQLIASGWQRVYIKK